MSCDCRSPSNLIRTLFLGIGSVAALSCSGEDVTAPTTGQIAVTTTITGSEPDPDGFTLTLDGIQGDPIAGNASRSLTVTEGSHTVELGGLAPNCSVDGGTGRTVVVPARETVPVVFAVVCGATTGGLRVLTVTNGDLPDPDGYAITVDGGDPQPIAVNGELDLTALAPGDHAVQLSGIADNCSVAGDDPATVTVTAGASADLTFTVSCQGSVQRWTEMNSNTRADLPDVWGSSASDVFVVGEALGGSEADVISVIVHFDGTSWSRQFRRPDLSLRGVWGSSASDVWAVGSDFLASEGELLHYDGTAWRELPPVLGNGEDLTLEAIWGSSATDVFAVGGAFDGLFLRSLILHYDGTTWQRMPVSGDVAPGLTDVWGSGATDVYAIGRDDLSDPAQAVIMHYDGTGWSPVVQDESLTLTGIWGSSATDVFVSGFEVQDDGNGGFLVIGTIRHFDGSAWSKLTVPATGNLFELWGSSSRDVFAVGDGVILHFDGTTWSATNPTSRVLLGVWGSSPADVFAVGEGGIILHGTP